MKNKLFILFAFALLASGEGCIEEGEPDLYWQDYQTIYNPCTGQNEYLNVSHFFLVNNLNNPNYPPQVWLYYNDDLDIFTDCFGFQWFIVPGSYLISNRYMTNKTGGKTARTPAAQAYVTVKEDNGQVHDMPGGTVVFNDVPPGQTVALNTTIAVDYNNSKYLTEYSADPDDVIAEEDETNNVSNDNFSRSASAEGFSFKIRVPNEEELAKIKTRYILYKNGSIEVRN